jgi:hypothetical protein
LFHKSDGFSVQQAAVQPLAGRQLAGQKLLVIFIMAS